jgi:hypothetical protein
MNKKIKYYLSMLSISSAPGYTSKRLKAELWRNIRTQICKAGLFTKTKK